MIYLPGSIFIDITDTCNLKCLHCIKASGPSNRNKLTIKQINRIFSQLNEAGCQSIILTGGEPLLHPDFWEILETAAGMFNSVYIDTNGTLLTERNVKRILDYKNIKVQISLEGTKEINDKIRGKGSFIMTVKGIKRLVKNGLVPVIATTINNYNYQSLEKTHRLLNNLKINFWRLMVLMKQGRAINNYPRLFIGLEEWNKVIKKVKKIKGKPVIDATPLFKFIGQKMPEMLGVQIKMIGCEAGKRRANILCNGDVIPCSMLPQYIAGNIFKNNFKDIWFNSPVIKQFRNFDFKKIKECAGCNYLKYCKGGCRGMALEFYQQIYRADPRCPLLKK